MRHNKEYTAAGYSVIIQLLDIPPDADNCRKIDDHAIGGVLFL
jgi:hypothetical protein